MKNIYATIDKQHSAIFFSKKMIKQYLKFFPNAKFEVFSDIEDAIKNAKPANYNSEKIYAVKDGIIRGMFYTLKEYETFISGIKNSCGKKCSNINDAFKYIYNTRIPNNLNCTQISRKNKFQATIFVDGSFFKDNNMMGIAYNIQSTNNIFSHSSFIKTNHEGSSTKAELISTMMAVERAIQEKIEKATIFYDNSQIFNLLHIDSKDTFNQEYSNFIKNAYRFIDLSFKKIKSHSGNSNNNNVDRLARHKNIDKFLHMLSR